MAKLSIPYQNLEFAIPDDGEIFKTTDGTLYVRQGNSIASFDRVAATGGQAVPASYTIQQFEQRYGSGAYNSLPTYTEDALVNFQRSTGGATQAVSDISMFDPAKSEKNGGSITQEVSPDNPNGVVVTNSDTGQVIQQSPVAPGPQQAPEGSTIAYTGTSSLPATDLQPGDRGAEVEQLQRFLVANGYMTQAEMDTGPGIYGPRTTEAVRKLQNALGVDNSSGPGYFGPLTRASIGASGTTSAPDTGTSGGTQTFENRPTEEDQTLEQILSGANLSQDQKDLITNIYNTVSTNDEENARRLSSAISAAMEYSDPYFKAQARIVIDSIQRGFVDADQDLAFKEAQLQNTLNDLKADIATSKDTLTFEQQQELKNLERSYNENLDSTRQNLAATGLTSSSIRSRKEQLLSDTYGDLRTASTRNYQTQLNRFSTEQNRAERDTAAEVARLNELTKSGKIDLLRQGEETLGSAGLGDLPTLSGYQPLGGIVGTIPQAQAQDALSFAHNLIF